MLLIILFALSLMVSAITIRTGISLSHSFGIVDHPSEHKQHTASTPFVGGLGIFFALIVALRITDYFQLSSDIRYMWMELAALAIFVTGFADDIWRLDYKVRFLVQAVVASVMALWGGWCSSIWEACFPADLSSLACWLCRSRCLPQSGSSMR